MIFELLYGITINLNSLGSKCYTFLQPCLPEKKTVAVIKILLVILFSCVGKREKEISSKPLVEGMYITKLAW